MQAVQSRGGLLTLDDLASHKSEIIETPISIDYHDWTIWEIPPSGQGITALIALGIIQCLEEEHGLDFTKLEHNSAEYLHVIVEALRLAFADTRYYVTDPQVLPVPTEKLLSKVFFLLTWVNTSPTFPNTCITEILGWTCQIDQFQGSQQWCGKRLSGQWQQHRVLLGCRWRRQRLQLYCKRQKKLTVIRWLTLHTTAQNSNFKHFGVSKQCPSLITSSHTVILFARHILYLKDADSPCITAAATLCLSRAIRTALAPVSVLIIPLFPRWSPGRPPRETMISKHALAVSNTRYSFNITLFITSTKTYSDGRIHAATRARPSCSQHDEILC